MEERKNAHLSISVSPETANRVKSVAGIGKEYRNVSAFFEVAALRELVKAERRAQR